MIGSGVAVIWVPPVVPRPGLGDLWRVAEHAAVRAEVYRAVGAVPLVVLACLGVVVLFGLIRWVARRWRR